MIACICHVVNHLIRSAHHFLSMNFKVHDIYYVIILLEAEYSTSTHNNIVTYTGSNRESVWYADIDKY